MESQDLITEYQDILTRNGIPGTVEKVDVEVPALAGEHLGSDCLCVTLHLDDGSSRELFVKVVSPNSPDFFKDAELFRKESSFVNVLLKEFHTVHENAPELKQHQAFDFFPNYLHADETKIVMDKLGKEIGQEKGKGYFQVSKSDKLDLSSTKYVLRNLALFHSLSYGATPEEYLKRYPFLAEKFYTDGKDVFDISYNNLLRAKIAILKSANFVGTDQAVKFLEHGLGTVFRQVRKAVNHNSQHLFHVVNHGDCWITNMMFKMDDELDEIAHQVFLDFQFVRLGSPNLDLSYFLFSSTRPNVLQNNWKYLLEYYFENLRSNVHGLQKRFPHTFEEFLDDFSSKLGFGFWLNMTLFQGFDLFAHVDMQKVEGDVEDTGLEQQVAKWIQNHTPRAKELASEIMTLVETFNQMKNHDLASTIS